MRCDVRNGGGKSEEARAKKVKGGTVSRRRKWLSVQSAQEKSRRFQEGPTVTARFSKQGHWWLGQDVGREGKLCCSCLSEWEEGETK